LAYLLLFRVLALLSGARSYRDIITFLAERREVLNAHFGTTLKRALALNTLRTILRTLPPGALEAAFRLHARALMETGKSSDMPAVAIDGKVLRGSFDPIHDRKAAGPLSTFANEAALILAHAEISDKSNETPAAEAMIRDLGLTGVIFTADAIHC
jgi:hypothetical protein